MDQVFSLRCKNCGYKLRYNENKGMYVCDACGSEFQIDTDVASDENFIIVAGVLEKYTGASPLVKIPEGVSIIGNNCFAGMELIESISLPNGVIKIGDSAFCGCSGLKYVSIPETVSTIGNCAFKESGLKDVVLPNSITNIGKDAFMGCTSLQKAVLPHNQVVNLERTFKQCSFLSDVECNLNNFCLSFKPSSEAMKNGDTKPTLFDAFQATPYLANLRTKQSSKQCVICGSAIGDKGVCTHCGAKHVDLSGGCYIATAVYGSYDCPPVWTLRRYRDNTLAKSWYGRALIHIYYAISPTLVKWFGDSSWFKNIWKNILDKMVKNLQSNGVDSTSYND